MLPQTFENPQFLRHHSNIFFNLVFRFTNNIKIIFFISTNNIKIMLI